MPTCQRSNQVETSNRHHTPRSVHHQSYYYIFSAYIHINSIHKYTVPHTFRYTSIVYISSYRHPSIHPFIQYSTPHHHHHHHHHYPHTPSTSTAFPPSTSPTTRLIHTSTAIHPPPTLPDPISHTRHAQSHFPSRHLLVQRRYVLNIPSNISGELHLLLLAPQADTSSSPNAYAAWDHKLTPTSFALLHIRPFSNPRRLLFSSILAPVTATQQAVLKTYFCLCGEFLVRTRYPSFVSPSPVSSVLLCPCPRHPPREH